MGLCVQWGKHASRFERIGLNVETKNNPTLGGVREWFSDLPAEHEYVGSIPTTASLDSAVARV